MGSLSGRLRGSHLTSTLEPDMGNASVGKVIPKITEGDPVAFRFFIYANFLKKK